MKGVIKNMGVPEWHYKRALQAFAHALAFEVKDYKLAKELVEERDNMRLEEYILHMKEELSSITFYYLAGRATQLTIDEADEMGIDSLNAAACGLGMFEDFIGIEENEEDEQ